MEAIDPFAVVYALLWLGIAAAILAFPVWLSVQVVAAVRARRAIPWRTRIGDRERDALRARLADDYAAGRIAFWEFEGRVEDTWKAATYSDLRAIATDLPPAPPLRAFTLVDLVAAFVAGLVAVAVSPLAALVIAFGIVLRRRAR
jgi:uncharacterized protein DUF1707